MCFVKCWDFSSSSNEDIELLSSGKKWVDYRIRKLIDKKFIWKSKYKFMKELWKTDYEILEELEIQAKCWWVLDEFNKIINSWKEKVDTLLEL
jgi:hypothetical protein